ncbi:MAG: T9SS type A sorting domain-containing protein [Bacteroidales bacterium]|jgi:hypothetical protein|nr:T9SS type A sorting domain-containing protein [Bacteroidales bacterium]
MKKKTFTLVTVSILLITGVSYGQVVTTDEIHVNNIKALISNVGNHFGDSEGRAKYEVPAGSNCHTMLRNSLWIGGLDANSLISGSAELYRQEEVDGITYYPGPLVTSGACIGTTNNETVHEYNKIWKINRFEIEEFRERFENNNMNDYVIPESILSWPANGDTDLGHSAKLAPFTDRNNDGIYNPEDGDYPLIKGDYAMFFIFNDAFRNNMEKVGRIMGIEVHGMVYAFSTDDDIFGNTIFMNYKIINRSSHTYYNTYVGLYTDFDIGFPNDDYIGCDVPRSCYYAYNGDNNDESAGGYTGYGNNPPVQAVVLLAGPPLDNDETDNPSSYQIIDGENVLICDENIFNGNINGMNFGDGIVDNERWGMNRFMYFNNNPNGHPATRTPEKPSDYYNYLTGKWTDSTNLYYNGTGHYSGATTTDTSAYFMFPGNSDKCNWGTEGLSLPAWSMETEANTPVDVRGIASSGPFTFKRGQEIELDFAFVTIFPSESERKSIDINDMLRNIDAVREAFINNDYPEGTQLSIINNNVENNENIILYPNPANKQVEIILTADVKITNIEILDINGRLVNIIKTSDNNKIDISSLTSGTYFVKIYTGKKYEVKKLIVQ